MVRKRFIDAKTATKFQVLHRPQTDPLAHDDSAPPIVLCPVGRGGGKESKHATTKGTAAECGIYFDDADEYDYMQHIRELGMGSGSVWIGADSFKRYDKRLQQRGDGEMEERDKVIDYKVKVDKYRDDFGENMFASENQLEWSLAAQQDVPDEIRGFKPELDERVREVLEALEDDSYVVEHITMEQHKGKVEEENCIAESAGNEDREAGKMLRMNENEIETANEDEEFFREIAQGGNALTMAEWIRVSANEYEEKEEHWDELGEGASDEEDWMKEFRKFKLDQSRCESQPVNINGMRKGKRNTIDGNSGFVNLGKEDNDGVDTQQRQKPKSSITSPNDVTEIDIRAKNREHDVADLASRCSTHYSYVDYTFKPLKKKKRKGALTCTSSYSMTSSLLVRTDQMELLDKRFDILDKKYRDDGDNNTVSGWDGLEDIDEESEEFVSLSHYVIETQIKGIKLTLNEQNYKGNDNEDNEEFGGKDDDSLGKGLDKSQNNGNQDNARQVNFALMHRTKNNSTSVSGTRSNSALKVTGKFGMDDACTAEAWAQLEAMLG